MKRIVILAVLFLAAQLAHAQFGAGVAFITQHLTNTNAEPYDSAWVYGPSFFLQAEAGETIRVGFDGRCALTSGNGVSVRSATFGPRVAVAPKKLHAKIYAELEFGVVDVQPAPGRLRTGHLDTMIAIGLDHKLLRHLDWRVFEYAFSGTNGFDSEDARQQFSSGLVVHF